MTFMMHTGRQQRSFAGKAPILSDHEPAERKTYTVRRTEIKTFKFNNRYINSMLDEMFRGW